MYFIRQYYGIQIEKIMHEIYVYFFFLLKTVVSTYVRNLPLRFSAGYCFIFI